MHMLTHPHTSTSDPTSTHTPPPIPPPPIQLAPCRVVDYSGYTPGRPHSSVFDTPDLCRDAQEQAVARHTATQLRLLSLLPTVRYRGDPKVGCRNVARSGRVVAGSCGCQSISTKCRV